MAADLSKRFWISLALTLPILALSPMLQSLVGLQDAVRFSGDLYVLFGFSSAVFWYGGWPFLKGLYTELTTLKPGVMTLVAVAITTAYLYSSAVVFGLTGVEESGQKCGSRKFTRPGDQSLRTAKCSTRAFDTKALAVLVA